MGLRACKKCLSVHDWTHEPCLWNDPPDKVPAKARKALAQHRGLPHDCPGCLGLGTITLASYGKPSEQGANTYRSFTTTCAACGVVTRVESRNPRSINDLLENGL